MRSLLPPWYTRAVSKYTIPVSAARSITLWSEVVMQPNETRVTRRPVFPKVP